MARPVYKILNTYNTYLPYLAPRSNTPALIVAYRRLSSFNVALLLL